MNKEIQEKNFEYLSESAEVQRQVRNCEIEGTAYGIEKYFESVHAVNLISWKQLNELLRILKREKV